MVAGPEMEVRLPRRRFPPGLPGFTGNLRKRHFLPFFRLCAAASSPALLCCSERGVAELLGCGLVRAALGMQSMTEPELKALMEQCTEAVTAAADATEAEAQERLGNVAAALLLQLRAAGWQLFQDPITKEWLTCRATAAVAPEAAAAGESQSMVIYQGCEDADPKQTVVPLNIAEFASGTRCCAAVTNSGRAVGLGLSAKWVAPCGNLVKTEGAPLCGRHKDVSPSDTLQFPKTEAVTANLIYGCGAMKKFEQTCFRMLQMMNLELTDLPASCLADGRQHIHRTRPAEANK